MDRWLRQAVGLRIMRCRLSMLYSPPRQELSKLTRVKLWAVVRPEPDRNTKCREKFSEYPDDITGCRVTFVPHTQRWPTRQSVHIYKVRIACKCKQVGRGIFEYPTRDGSMANGSEDRLAWSSWHDRKTVYWPGLSNDIVKVSRTIPWWDEWRRMRTSERAAVGTTIRGYTSEPREYFALRLSLRFPRPVYRYFQEFELGTCLSVHQKILKVNVCCQ